MGGGVELRNTVCLSTLLNKNTSRTITVFAFALPSKQLSSAQHSSAQFHRLAPLTLARSRPILVRSPSPHVLSSTATLACGREGER